MEHADKLDGMLGTAESMSCDKFGHIENEKDHLQTSVQLLRLISKSCFRVGIEKRFSETLQIARLSWLYK